MEQMLITSTIQKGESYIDFGKRLQVIRSKLALKIKTTHINVIDGATKLVHLNQYEKLATKIFVRNLNQRLRDKVIVLGPPDLETAMAHVIEDENFQQFQQPLQSFKPTIPKIQPQMLQSRQVPQNNRLPFHTAFNQPQFQRNFQAQTSQNQNFQQTPQRYYPNNQIPPQFYVKPQFPSRPITIQQRQLPPQKFPTNQQVFGKPQNVWKPNNNTIHSKPTPMSTTSRQSSTNAQTLMNNMPRNPPFQGQYVSTNNYNPQLNWISEELFNQETNSDMTPIEYYPEIQNEDFQSNQYFTPEQYQNYDCLIPDQHYDDTQMTNSEINENVNFTQDPPIEFTT